MCRINIANTIRHHISPSSLFARLGVEPFDSYYQRRLLRPPSKDATDGVGREPSPYWLSSNDLGSHAEEGLELFEFCK